MMRSQIARYLDSGSVFQEVAKVYPLEQVAYALAATCWIFAMHVSIGVLCSSNAGFQAGLNHSVIMLQGWPGRDQHMAHPRQACAEGVIRGTASFLPFSCTFFLYIRQRSTQLQTFIHCSCCTLCVEASS